MTWRRRSRKYHKWLMLLLGLQFVIWSVSGLYMVVLDINYIHGNSMVNNSQIALESKHVNYSLAQLYEQYPEATHIELTQILGSAVYRFHIGQNSLLISAVDGKLLSPLTEQDARFIAKSRYTDESAQIVGVSLINENPPRELSARHLPVWRVDFDTSINSSFYISVYSGKLVTKRHDFWRIFDWMFSFHVMDYIEEDASNKLLFFTIILALLGSFFGLILTYFSVFSYTRRKSEIAR